MGIYQAKQPMFPKELVRPASMIKPAADPFQADALAQNAANPTTYPLIYSGKGPLVAMLKVFEPSPEGTIDVSNDRRHALAIATPGFGSDGVLQFLQTLLARSAGAAPKAVAKKIKALSGSANIHQPGLFRVQAKFPVPGQLPHQSEGRMGLVLAAAKNHEIIRVADHFKSGFSHGHIDWMQVQLGEQGTADSCQGGSSCPNFGQ